MSAFDWHNSVSVHGPAARRAFVWLAAALALATTGAVYAQGANSIDSIGGVRAGDVGHPQHAPGIGADRAAGPGPRRPALRLVVRRRRGRPRGVHLGR